ncbi:glycosyltransferase family 4 protein [Neisseria sp. CCUG12390]|uniref:glycosyltransferase family 4 protein n=1 Tax=Neisseria sp. CCUG12390 TaxID=3392035 RepID=UPI003A0FDB6A
MTKKIVLTSAMDGLGGTENATFRLGRLLKARGHDIILASSDGPLIKEAKELGIRWFPIDFYQGGKAGYIKAMFAYMKMLRQEKPDVVHCQMARIVPACAVAAKIASPKTKVFYHARGLDPQTYPKIAKLFDKLGVYIIGNCKHEQQKLIRHGFPAERVTYTYNALHKVDYVPEKTQKDYVMLGTLSRLDTVRAVHLMLDIFKKMIDRGLPVRLNIAGIGEEMENLKAQAERLQIDDKVTFLGGVRDLTGYFKEVDILVNTPHCIGDHGAGVGNNILESGLYDTPVVTYDMAGISEMVINGQTGFCIPFGDEEQFIGAVEQLVHNPALRQQIGKALHEHVARLCSDDEIYRTTMAAYDM